MFQCSTIKILRAPVLYSHGFESHNSAHLYVAVYTLALL